MAQEIARLAVVLEYLDGTVVHLESQGPVRDVSVDMVPTQNMDLDFDALELPVGFGEYRLRIAARLLRGETTTYTTTKMYDWPIGGEDA